MEFYKLINLFSHGPLVGGLLPEATMNKKGLMSADSYKNTQVKTIPNNISNDYYEIADIPKGCFACIEVNGSTSSDFFIARIIVNYSSTRGFNYKVHYLLNQQPGLIGFYTDGISKLYVNRRTSFSGGIKVVFTTNSFNLTMENTPFTEGLIEIQ